MSRRKKPKTPDTEEVTGEVETVALQVTEQVGLVKAEQMASETLALAAQTHALAVETHELQQRQTKAMETIANVLASLTVNKTGL